MRSRDGDTTRLGEATQLGMRDAILEMALGTFQVPRFFDNSVREGDPNLLTCHQAALQSLHKISVLPLHLLALLFRPLQCDFQPCTVLRRKLCLYMRNFVISRLSLR
jgi:hypothetical protein